MIQFTCAALCSHVCPLEEGESSREFSCDISYLFNEPVYRRDEVIQQIALIIIMPDPYFEVFESEMFAIRLFLV